MIHTTMWVGGDVIYTRLQTTRKSLVLLAKTNVCVCTINKNYNKTAESASTLVYKLCNIDHEIRQFSKLIAFFGCTYHTHILSRSKAWFHLSRYTTLTLADSILHKIRC
jgi:hypothetical protein